jgi:hypothetical protein
MENRIASLFQIDSDRSEWQKFLDEVKKMGFKEGSDFFPNPGGNASAMFKTDIVADPRLKKLKDKFRVGGINAEDQEAGTYVRESTYVVGDKVKVWMGGGKKMLGEVKKITFGDGHYMVELANGQQVQRSTHELEFFRESDKTIQKKDKHKSLDEAVESAMEGMMSEENELSEDDTMSEDCGMIDGTDDMMKSRRAIIGREMDNMTTDEKVEEAIGMSEKATDPGVFAGYSDCCGVPVYGESERCSKCGEMTTVIPTEEHQIEEDFGTQEDTMHEGDMEISETGGEDLGRVEFEKYLDGELDRPPVMEGVVSEETLNEYKDQEFVPVKDSSFIVGVAYDDAMKVLYVKFKQYGVYEYQDVPEKVYRAFLAAPSMGKFFHSQIRNKYTYNLNTKFKKAGRPAIKRNEELVGAPSMTENTLSSRESKVKFIIENVNSLPYGTIQNMIFESPEMALEKLTNTSEENINKIYESTKATVKADAIDEKLEGVMEEGEKEEGLEEGIFRATTSTYKHIDTLNESEWKEYKAKAAKYGLNCFYNDNKDAYIIESSDRKAIEAPAKKISTERYTILKEDVETVINIAKAKGYKVLEVKGELVESKKEGVMLVLVEKAGFKTIVSYDDNAINKPWSWEGRHFNFMQEALDSVFIPGKQILAENLKKERASIISKQDDVEQLLEQQKYSPETKNLPEREKTRREKRSQEILKKMMNQDLIKRGFNR